MAPVIWIVDAEHWPRAGLRAELIERGYDAIGFPTLRDAVLGLRHIRRPALMVIDLQGQDLGGGDLDQLLAQADRTAPHGDLLGREVQVLGECVLEFEAAVVGVAVDDVGRPLDRRANAGQRPEHRLVAGQLDGARNRLARHVNGEPVQLGT